MTEEEGGQVQEKRSGGPGSGSDEDEEIKDFSGEMGAILKRKERIKKREAEVQRREVEQTGWCCGFFT